MHNSLCMWRRNRAEARTVLLLCGAGIGRENAPWNRGWERRVIPCSRDVDSGRAVSLESAVPAVPSSTFFSNPPNEQLPAVRVNRNGFAWSGGEGAREAKTFRLTRTDGNGRLAALPGVSRFFDN